MMGIKRCQDLVYIFVIWFLKPKGHETARKNEKFML
jgi:hypothetical protein